MPLSIFLCGAHSTGKTTLINKLKRELPNIKSEAEYARNVIKRMGLNRDSFDWKKHPEVFEKVQLEILNEQSQMYRRHEKDNEDYIADRGIDPLVYARYYLGEDALNRLLSQSLTKSCIERFRTSLTFVLLPQPECVDDDGFRIKPVLSDLQGFTDHLIELLNQLNINYFVIDFLDLEQRKQFVVDKINESRS
ncbi:Uncharacterised protein g4438 [Pycnogonum litorale]